MEQAQQGRVIGYARTSTTDQKLDLQLDALRAAGADPIFKDQVSGMRTKRPGLDKALAALKAGDTLAVWKLDRLGRSLPHLVNEVAGLKERGVGFRSLTESIDTGTPHGRLLFGLFGTLAEFERELTKERVAAGRDAAKKAGRKMGRRQKLDGKKLAAIRRELAAGIGPHEVAASFGVSRSTLYAALAREEQQAADRASIPAKRGRGRPKKVSPAEGEATAP